MLSLSESCNSFAKEVLRRLRKVNWLLNDDHRLGQDILYDLPMNVRESKISSLIPVSEPLVIKTEQMQYGRLQIMNMHFVASH